MKKLFKKPYMLDETIEAYSCDCKSCNCSALRICDCGILLWMRSTVDSDTLAFGDFGNDLSSSNYGK